MEEVAGVLVGDTQGEWFEGLQRRGDAEAREKFRDVADFSAEGYGLRVFRFAGGEKMIVFLERGAAAGGVRDDRVEILKRERREVFAGEVAGDIAHSCMRRQSAAAELCPRDDDFAAVASENADGGVIELREGDLGDAAGEKGDTRAARPDGGKGAAELLEEKRVVNAREQAFAVGEAEKLQDTGGAGKRLQAKALIEAQDAGDDGDAVGPREQFAEHKLACQAGEERALVIALDDGAGVLHELAVLDGGRAHGFAGTAVEAFVDVIDERSGDRAAEVCAVCRGALFGVRWLGLRGLSVFGLRDMDHLVNAAARRIGFEVPEAVRGAGAEA